MQQREALLREMEAVSTQTARETQRQREGQTSCAEELKAQVRNNDRLAALLSLN